MIHLEPNKTVWLFFCNAPRDWHSFGGDGAHASNSAIREDFLNGGLAPYFFSSCREYGTSLFSSSLRLKINAYRTTTAF